MAASREGQRSRFTIVVLVMVCLTLITVDTKANGGGVVGSLRSRSRDLLAPVQGGLAGVANPVADFADGLINSGDLKAENRRLRDENDRLQGQILQQADAQRERDALLDLNRLDVVKDIKGVPARVINASPSNLELTVEINRGADQGVAVGMPVVTGAGLVGRVESTTGKRSIVRLISDKEVHVAVRLASTGLQTAVVGGGDAADLVAETIKPAEAVPEDEVVVTSGLEGGKYPKGIPVGKVSSAKAVAGVAYQDVRVKPVVDLSRLEFVNVLLWKGT